ncbi:MAG: hypothetical protein ORN28_10915 [Rhodoferax sp.]|nr:hypothetical protein [Rhodoferax sp.]
MKKYLTLTVFAVLGAGLSGAVQAQDAYLGVGLPGLYSLGYANPFGTMLGVRVEYAGGLSVNAGGNQEGVHVAGSFKASRFGAFADWFPFEGSFRLVGGITINDMKANFSGLATGISTINNIKVDMTGQNFNVEINFPKTTSYVGIGFGHQQSDSKGLGFYADLGLMVGSFSVTANTSLLNKPVGLNGEVIKQSDVDAQTQKVRDALNSIGALPSASMGLLYRF